MTCSTPARLYQPAVEQDDPAGSGQMGDVTLVVPLVLSVSDGLPRATIRLPRGLSGADALDGLALTRSVTPLEKNDELLPPSPSIEFCIFTSSMCSSFSLASYFLLQLARLRVVVLLAHQSC